MGDNLFSNLNTIFIVEGEGGEVEVPVVEKPKPTKPQRSQGKDMSNIEGMPEDECPPPIVRRKKPRKLTDLDNPEGDSGDQSEEYRASE